MNEAPITRKGRGARANPAGRFETRPSVAIDDGWGDDDCPPRALETELFAEKAKSVITTNRSPDVPFDQSINPYRGCEHGCVYCFARPSHAYVDLSPGLDFETKIFFKDGAAARLTEELAAPGYRCKTIALGTNTDPYQPAERQLRVTRSLLEVMLKCRHPVSIVTKGSLIERDLDLLAELAALGLTSVMLSITTLDNALKATLEPRAAAPAARLKCLRTLREAGVPAGVLIAPVIPGINDDEIEAIAERSADAGALSLGYVLLRLPFEVKDLFKDWLRTHAPLKAERVMGIIRAMRGGLDYDSTWGERQKGIGPYAALLARRFELVRQRLGFAERTATELRTDLFVPPDLSGQMRLI